MLTAVLVTLWTAVCTFDNFACQTCLRRPLFAGAITGLIMGDFTQGMIIASTIELMWLGVTAIGAYVPPDVISGAVLGTAFGILSGQGAVAGVAIAVPVAVAVQQLDILARTVSVYFTHKADKAALEGDFDKAGRYHWLCLPLFLLTRCVPVFLAMLIGAEYVEQLFNAIPAVIMNGLSVSGNILPALGFGLLLSLMINKKLWVFFLLGFILSIYFNVPTIGLALVGVVFAVLYDQFTYNKTAAVETVAHGDEDGGYDL